MTRHTHTNSTFVKEVRYFVRHFPSCYLWKVVLSSRFVTLKFILIQRRLKIHSIYIYVGINSCPVDYCMHWQRDTFGKIMLNNTTGNDVRNTLPLSQKLSLCEYALKYHVANAYSNQLDMN
jgi:hypothetical protein